MSKDSRVLDRLGIPARQAIIATSLFRREKLDLHCKVFNLKLQGF